MVSKLKKNIVVHWMFGNHHIMILQLGLINRFHELLEHIDGLVLDGINFIANVLEIPQFSAKPLVCDW